MAELPHAPIITENGKKYSIRCGRCADVRGTVVTQTTLVHDRNKVLPRKVVEIKTGLVCDAPNNVRYVDESGVMLPPIGQVVEKYTYCPVFREKIFHQSHKQSKSSKV